MGFTNTFEARFIRTYRMLLGVLKRTIGGHTRTFTRATLAPLSRGASYRFNEREDKDGYRFAKATKIADGSG